MEMTTRVFKPDWLQSHPQDYMESLFEQSQQAIEKQAKGGYQHNENDSSVLNATVNNLCCKLILALDPVTDVKRKLNQPQYKILSSLFYRYCPYPNDIPLCVVERIVLICHHW